MQSLIRLLKKNKSVRCENPLKTADIIQTQKALVKQGCPFLPAEFIDFLKSCNGAKGVDSVIFGIPPLANEDLDIIKFNQALTMPKGYAVLGMDDFCYLVYDQQSEQYRLLTRDSGVILETFNQNELEDALTGIIHLDEL